MSISTNLTTYLSNKIRPKGVNKIIFSSLEPTHVRFSWQLQNSPATIVINQIEFGKLTPELRYFVLMHEVGHIQKMNFLQTTATEQDEDEADDFAIEECAKIGIYFKNAATARELYRQALH